MRRAILLTAIGGLLALPAPAAADHTIVKTAQLDGDPELERVERRFTECPAGINGPEGPDACGYVAVVDGDVDARLTPIDQRPRFDYGWVAQQPVVLRDLTGDGLPELIWQLSTAGGTGGSPAMMGVHRWVDRRAAGIFRYAGGLGRRLWSKPIWLKPGRVRDGLRELKLRDLLYRPRDSTCCPSFVRDRRLRWDGERMRFVRGATRVRRGQSARR